MTPKESDLLQLENELLSARNNLNALICEYDKTDNDFRNAAIWQDKLHYFETELKYLNNQLQLLKNTPYQAPSTFPPPEQTAPAPAPVAPPVRTRASIRDYEKLFGRNFMGVCASVLIFISLIIFATLMLPYLTDTMKLIGLYAVSFAILLAGYIPERKNKANKFCTVLIGCGIGSLYISLLLSDLYFKVIGDVTLYILIIVWAVFLKYLPGLKNMVFHLIGQSGILIATILGTVLCVRDADASKFMVLTVFYFLSALVFAGRDRSCHAQNLCNHICKALNLIVFTVGFSLMKPTDLRVINILIVMLYMLSEFYFSYREEYRHGLAFQLLTMTNAVTLIFLFRFTEFFSTDAVYSFMYIVSIAMLFYVRKKSARLETLYHDKKAVYEIVSEVFFLVLIFLACHNHPFIQDHLYAYLTVIPAMLYGRMRNRNLYLYAGSAFAADLLLLVLSGVSIYSAADFSMTPYAEYLIMTAAIYLVFLFVSRTTDHSYFKICSYILISVILAALVHESSFSFMRHCNLEHIRTIEYITVKANLIPFFVLALLHLLMTKFNMLGTGKPVRNMMYVVNVLLMTAGCISIGCRPWRLVSIMITALLFLINSRELLQRTPKAGYYIALKYTVFMVCVLNAYDVNDYAISISLLLFAIASIIIGFYRNTVTFRLYGLLLSMISIVKLIMVDIRYDSTMENAISFFLSGILCFGISFLYHKIDTSFNKKS